MKDTVRRILQDNNYIISSDDYKNFFSPLNDADISYVKYMGDCDKFQVVYNNCEYVEFKVNKVKVKK